MKPIQMVKYQYEGKFKLNLYFWFYLSLNADTEFWNQRHIQLKCVRKNMRKLSQTRMKIVCLNCFRYSITIFCSIFNGLAFSQFSLAVKGFDRKEVIPCHSPPRIASHIFNVLPSPILNIQYSHYIIELNTSITWDKPIT